MSNKSKSLTTVDLFCGAGGISEGFKSSGYRTLYANDLEEPALQTFKRNHSDCITSSEDIRKIDPKKILSLIKLKRGELDCLVGGPPCQGFSTYGKRDLKDLRNQLYNDFLRFVKVMIPKTFLIENVPGIVSFNGGKVVDDIINKAKKIGYTTNIEILNASNFGVPQNRQRTFIVGSLGNIAPVFPLPTHGDVNRDIIQEDLFKKTTIKKNITVREAISDLPGYVSSPKETQESLPYPDSKFLTDYQRQMRKASKKIYHHSSKRMLGIRLLRLSLLNPGDYGNKLKTRIDERGLDEELLKELLGNGNYLRSIEECRTQDREKELELKRIMKMKRVSSKEILNIIESGGFANKYRRLNWDTLSHTLVAHMARDCSDFVHPEQNRFISVREAARLQSFPDKYLFEGSQFRQFRQIGNAVPPILAEKISAKIKDFIH